LPQRNFSFFLTHFEFFFFLFFIQNYFISFYRFSNEKILRACYRWIGVNLVRKNLFPTFNDEFDALNGNEENISSKRLHFISNHCLSFDQVAISSKIFESVIQKFISEKARYYEYDYFSFSFLFSFSINILKIKF